MTSHNTENVMILEDIEDISKHLSEFLRGYQLHSKIFYEGQSALEYCQKNDPLEIKLIITDLHMPLMDGFTFIENIQKSELWKDIPIIIHSSLNSLASRTRAEKLGVKEYVEKFNYDRLSIILSKFMNL